MLTSPSILIDGEWVDHTEQLDVRNPVDGSLVGRVAYGGAEHARAAADAAARAFPGWSTTPARVRSDLLLEAAARIVDRADEIGRILAREAGKRLPEAVAEVRFSAEYFRWFAEEARRPRGAVHTEEAADRRHLSIERPAGVAASLSPWNFPCSIQARKMAAALAAGCTVVARVSEQAPLAATEMVRCLSEAGLPAGAVNLVHGPAAEVTDAYLAHPSVRVVSFTGSTAVGRRVMAIASERVVRPLLELGGNASFVVLDDADVGAAISGAMLAKFRNTGQSCIAANRFFVHDAVFDDFVDGFAAAIDAMTIGDGVADPTPDLASCIDAGRAAAVGALIEEALDAGARKVTRDVVPPGPSFCAPALLTHVPEEARLATEEVFGPAAAVFRFDDDDDLIAHCNDTELGLASYVYGRDQSRLWHFAEHLDVGILGMNNALPSVVFAPMGGTKQSGLGREGARDGLAEFQTTRYLAIGV